MSSRRISVVFFRSLKASSNPSFTKVQNLPTAALARRHASGMDSITYSGGQANVGQGGFYGSGGARASLAPGSEHRPGMIALAADVQRIESTMEELEKLEAMERSMVKDGKLPIEVRGMIKKLMTNPEVVQCLKRLEVKGEPVWGLSSAERDLIRLAREKMNNC